MVVDDRAEVVADVDHVHAGVRPGSVLELREVRAVGLLDRVARSPSVLPRPACRPRASSAGTGARAAPRSSASSRRPPPQPASRADERKERDTVQPMLALTPTPIGVGPAYHPRPRCTRRASPRRSDGGDRAHLELFANGRVVIVPAAIGAPRRAADARPRRRCTLPRPRLDARPDRRRSLRRPHDARRPLRSLGTAPRAGRACSRFRGAVRVYVNGVRRRGDPRHARPARPRRDRARGRRLHPAAPHVSLSASLRARACRARSSSTTTTAATPAASATSDAMSRAVMRASCRRARAGRRRQQRARSQRARARRC